MELILILLTSIVLLSQFFLDFLQESKKKKIRIGAVILLVGLISLLITYVFQKNEKGLANSKHEKEIKHQQDRFNKLDSTNIALSSELKIRNGDLVFIKHQNDSLKFRLIRMQEKQDESLVISQYSAIEVNKSRVAIENMGYKQISRGISQQDKYLMINILKEFKNSKIKLTTIAGDQEAYQFSTQIKEVLESSGWKVDGIDQAFYNGPVTGINIKVKSNNYPKRVSAIFESFKILKFIAKGMVDSNLSADDVELIIGAK